MNRAYQALLNNAITDDEFMRLVFSNIMRRKRRSFPGRYAIAASLWRKSIKEHLPDIIMACAKAGIDNPAKYALNLFHQGRVDLDWTKKVVEIAVKTKTTDAGEAASRLSQHQGLEEWAKRMVEIEAEQGGRNACYNAYFMGYELKTVEPEWASAIIHKHSGLDPLSHEYLDRLTLLLEQQQE